MSIILNFLIAQVQALNCLIKLCDGWGTPDEMLSARAYRLRNQHPALIKWLDRLFFFDPHHCQAAYGEEIAREQFPEEYRGGK